MYPISDRRIRRFFFISALISLSLLLFTSAGHANWAITKRAQLINAQGHYLRFESINGKYVRLIFGLTRRDDGVFADKLPVYRVDGNAIHVIEKKGKYQNLKIVAGRYIYWIISRGKTQSKDLKEFISGRKAVFQYYRDDGKIMEAVFPLDGIKKAIEEIL